VRARPCRRRRAFGDSEGRLHLANEVMAEAAARYGDRRSRFEIKHLVHLDGAPAPAPAPAPRGAVGSRSLADMRSLTIGFHRLGLFA
jgi:hypothetical protein